MITLEVVQPMRHVRQPFALQRIGRFVLVRYPKIRLTAEPLANLQNEKIAKRYGLAVVLDLGITQSLAPFALGQVQDQQPLAITAWRV